MAGIAGIAKPGQKDLVNQMLDKIKHRGPEGRHIIELDNATFGIVYSKAQKVNVEQWKKEKIVKDDRGGSHSAYAQMTDKGLILQRDQLGVAPLYYAKCGGALCFASEVKALLEVTKDITQLPGGHKLVNGKPEQYFKLEKKTPIKDSPDVIAKELRRRLDESVKNRIVNTDTCASWLSGGLDSSTLAAIARKNVKTLHTFVAGIKGAPDVVNAKLVADYIKSTHHEVIVTTEDMLMALPKVIYHLESFDALLVRSSITNYLVAKAVSDYSAETFSGESGDELFAGYEYIKQMNISEIPDELIDITNRLQNTAFQRVDRSASAHGTVAHVGISDPDVIDYALGIPAEYKLNKGVEKWILREAMGKDLPDAILTRTKAKFWEGAGVLNLMAQYANKKISDKDFENEKVLPNGWMLSSKEELMNYRIFKSHFGELDNLEWMGRTKGATPVNQPSE